MRSPDDEAQGRGDEGATGGGRLRRKLDEAIESRFGRDRKGEPDGGSDEGGGTADEATETIDGDDNVDG